MADERASLILKVGDKEVRYEAERAAVEARLDHIVSRLLADAPADVRVGLAEEPPEAAGSPPPAATAPEAPQVLPEAERLAQLYAVGKGGRLRLRTLPERTADALLLVLYGMWKLRGRRWVHAPGMTSAARASGARFERADRLLAGYEDLLEKIGNRRARRYRLTAAGRKHCERLVESLVGTIAAGKPRPDVDAEPAAGEPQQPAAVEASADEAGIPEKVAAKWDGEVLTAAEAAERLGVEEAEVGKLRRASALLGLPGGDRRRRRYFYPAFQIDAARREVDPQAREVNQLLFRVFNSWDAASWWSSVDPELGKRPVELIGTPEADALVRAARARFENPG